MAYLFSHSASWYALFAVGMYAALAQCLCLFFIPETPSWLILHKKEEQAAKALKRLRSDKLSRNSSRDLFKLDSDKGEWKKMLTPKIIHALVIGLLLTIFQQITGINAVLNYAPKIFQFVGITSTEGCFLATLSVGIISFLATFFSFWVLDKLGRRSLLLVGTAVMAVSLGVLTLGFFMQSTYIDTMAFISLMVYVVAFSISLGPATGVVLSEIFPLKIRANAIALATALNALANYSVNFTFPHLIEKWGGDTTFALFSFLSLLAFLFIWQFLPETKGKSLEEIETMINLGQFKKP